MKKTAIQEVFSELENLHPHLFNIYSTEGKQFVNHFHKFLEIEKQQVIDAYDSGEANEYKASFNTACHWGRANKDTTPEQYYNETYKKVDI